MISLDITRDVLRNLYCLGRSKETLLAAKVPSMEPGTFWFLASLLQEILAYNICLISISNSISDGALQIN